MMAYRRDSVLSSIKAPHKCRGGEPSQGDDERAEAGLEGDGCTYE